jgi:membrane protein DedA with SNARE-associated domain/rhodanese-related sulfurtransferase
MPELILRLLNEYGTLLVFVNVLLVQLGLPVPAVPGLVIAGGLAAAGRLDPFLVVAAAVIASALADYVWYLAGRRLGYTVLTLLCRLSMSPVLCVRKVEMKYEQWGPGVLVCAKFIPGAATIAPPLAGVLHMPPQVFLLYASMGALLWAGTFVALGYALDVHADIVITALENYSAYVILAAGVVSSIMLLRSARCRHLLNTVDVTRISAEQVQKLLLTRADAVLIDVRSPFVRDFDGRQLPGARVFDVSELEKAIRSVPKQSHLIIFCACPDERSSAQVAKELRNLGYMHLSILKDGIDGWAQAGLPVLTLLGQS